MFDDYRKVKGHIMQPMGELLRKRLGWGNEKGWTVRSRLAPNIRIEKERLFEQITTMAQRTAKIVKKKEIPVEVTEKKIDSVWMKFIKTKEGIRSTDEVKEVKETKELVGQPIDKYTGDGVFM